MTSEGSWPVSDQVLYPASCWRDHQLQQRAPPCLARQFSKRSLVTLLGILETHHFFIGRVLPPHRNLLPVSNSVHWMLCPAHTGSWISSLRNFRLHSPSLWASSILASHYLQSPINRSVYTRSKHSNKWDNVLYWEHRTSSPISVCIYA